MNNHLFANRIEESIGNNVHIEFGLAEENVRKTRFYANSNIKKYKEKRN